MGGHKFDEASTYQLFNKDQKLKDENGQDLVIDLVDDILWSAIKIGASDIHLEPNEKNLRVRFRIDGVLYDQNPMDVNKASNIISRLKVLSSLDIAEKRVPQDGKVKLIFKNGAAKEKIIDLRISTFPSILGEKIVIRILDKSQNFIDLNSLGFRKNVLDDIKNIIDRPNGFILVTGPTGSGKTTTLYAVLSILNKPDKNIITMEDPVEYNIEGVTQSQINPKAGFSFDNGLRSILRQDPDVIMVGEIRDKPTCRIAIEASLTGHLVLSTLHTNDAAGAVTRLLDMGIESFLINGSLSAVLAQRLARKLCDHCKYEVELEKDGQEILASKNIKLKRLFRSKGCKKCFDLGYKGRMGIFELLIIDDAIRELISLKQGTEKIYEQALKNGMITLYQDGLDKVEQGLISLDEFLRVITD
ncbi:MAG: GspE/PulE family protein [bacterium]